MVDKIKYMTDKLKSLVEDIEFRDKFIPGYDNCHYLGRYQIVGYDGRHEISFRIGFYETELNSGLINKTQFLIEHKGHTFLNRIEYVSFNVPRTVINFEVKPFNYNQFKVVDIDKAFDCYYLILEDLIRSSELFKKRCILFPEFTKEDNRSIKIDKLLL